MSGIEELNWLKCSLTEKMLRAFWPEWHVTRYICAGKFSDVYEIRREYYGISSVSALKVVPFDKNGTPFELDPSFEISDLTGENTAPFDHHFPIKVLLLYRIFHFPPGSPMKSI